MNTPPLQKQMDEPLRLHQFRKGYNPHLPANRSHLKLVDVDESFQEILRLPIPDVSRETINESPLNAFWLFVVKTSTCWVWTGRRNRQGYGELCINGKTHSVHRFIFEAWNEVNLDGFYDCVLHKCDHPFCVHPFHLFRGTREDNIDDMVKKGRQRTNFEALNSVDPSEKNLPVGEDHWNHKLTATQVMEIRAIPHTSNAIIADAVSKYGVSRQTIYLIRQRKIWRNLP